MSSCTRRRALRVGVPSADTPITSVRTTPRPGWTASMTTTLGRGRSGAER
jgi:hypothetical protein